MSGAYDNCKSVVKKIRETATNNPSLKSAINALADELGRVCSDYDKHCADMAENDVKWAMLEFKNMVGDKLSIEADGVKEALEMEDSAKLCAFMKRNAVRTFEILSQKGIHAGNWDWVNKKRTDELKAMPSIRDKK